MHAVLTVVTFRSYSVMLLRNFVVVPFDCYLANIMLYTSMCVETMKRRTPERERERKVRERESFKRERERVREREKERERE